MSQENVEVVRRAMAAFNARDRDRPLSICDPEIELWSPFEQKTHWGLDEMVQWRDDLAAAMQDFHMEDSRVLDAGGDRVVVLYRRVGRGAGAAFP